MMIFRSNPIRFPIPSEQRIQVNSLDEVDFDDPIIIENLVSAMTAMLARFNPYQRQRFIGQPEQEG